PDSPQTSNQQLRSGHPDHSLPISSKNYYQGNHKDQQPPELEKTK
ncbi:23767_t:CDS:1, partial [Gigaspora rosea]